MRVTKTMVFAETEYTINRAINIILVQQTVILRDLVSINIFLYVEITRGTLTFILVMKYLSTINVNYYYISYCRLKNY